MSRWPGNYGGEIGTTATTITEGNLTVVEVTPATVETISEPETKPARKKKAPTEPAAKAKAMSQIQAAIQIIFFISKQSSKFNQCILQLKVTVKGSPGNDVGQRAVIRPACCFHSMYSCIARIVWDESAKSSHLNSPTPSRTILCDDAARQWIPAARSR